MENVFKVVMKLIVRPLIPSDFGEYKCVGKNALGESEKTVVLHRKWFLFNETKFNKSRLYFIEKSKTAITSNSHQPASQVSNAINRSGNGIVPIINVRYI